MATQSAESSRVMAAGPSCTSPRPAKITAAIQVVCTDTPHGPCRPSTGMASRVNPVSQPSTTAAQATPAASVRPTPCTRAAPQVTVNAAASTARFGRDPSRSGPSTASRGGTQATATPSMAGSACREPSTRPTLNNTSPVTVTPVSQSHSAPRGQTSLRPASRAKPTSSKQAAA
jgi:hypothetical protein